MLAARNVRDGVMVNLLDFTDSRLAGQTPNVPRRLQGVNRRREKAVCRRLLDAVSPARHHTRFIGLVGRPFVDPLRGCASGRARPPVAG